MLLIFLTLPSFAIAQSEVAGALAGVVFEDTDGDGRRGPGEPGLAGVVVCSRSDCAQTDGGGIYEVAVEPDGYRAVRAHWRRVPADPFEWLVNFRLEKTPSSRTFSFIHASDTHLDEESLPRIRLLRELTEARGVDFVIITGDLIRDALRVPEETALERYDLFREEKDAFPVPVWVVPGNHENFGIERHLSGVSEDHPLYGKAMYRRFLGPDLLFIQLWRRAFCRARYHRHRRQVVLRARRRDPNDLARRRPFDGARRDTDHHVQSHPALFGGAPRVGLLPGRRKSHRDRWPRAVPPHVSNYAEVLERFVDRNYPLALGGHGHAREEILLGDRRFEARFHQLRPWWGTPASEKGCSMRPA